MARRKGPQAQQAYEFIKKRIQNFELAPGAPVSDHALEQELKTGLTPQDCAGAFAAAAAMLTMDALDSAEGAVDSFTAGEVSIRTAAPSSGGSRSAAARRLLAPWLKERGFAFRGVSG